MDDIKKHLMETLYEADGKTPKTKFGKYNYPNAFRMYPRNSQDYCGSITLFSVKTHFVFRFDFGTGDNLDDSDRENGYDDYINYDVYRWDGKTNLTDIFIKLKSDEYMENIDGLEEVDGGMLLLKHADYEDSGDIRSYLAASLDMAGYVWDGGDKTDIYNDLIHIASCG